MRKSVRPLSPRKEAVLDKLIDIARGFLAPDSCPGDPEPMNPRVENQMREWYAKVLWPGYKPKVK